MAASERFTVPLEGGARVTAVTYEPARAKLASLVFAHGAGANQFHGFMVRFATGICERGVETTTFNFAYTEESRRVPDPAAKLEACFRAVIREVRGRGVGEGRLFLGGKSMGGRMASHVAAAGEPHLGGLVFLGYPLHPPGKPDKLRTQHLASISVPMLFVQGARDSFGTPEELRPHLSVPPSSRPDLATVVPIPDGDHSFKVPKRSGQSEESVWAAVLGAVEAFIRNISTA
jgi:uncharacterized protein